MTDKQAQRLRNYLDTAHKSGVKLLHLSSDELEGLLNELEAKDKLNAELMEKQRLIDICYGQGMEHRIAAEQRAEAAERRIAELEVKLAKPVLLPKTNGYWNEQEKAYEEAITLAKRQIRLAGFRCEGEG